MFGGRRDHHDDHELGCRHDDHRVRTVADRLQTGRHVPIGLGESERGVESEEHAQPAEHRRRERRGEFLAARPETGGDRTREHEQEHVREVNVGESDGAVRAERRSAQVSASFRQDYIHAVDGHVGERRDRRRLVGDDAVGAVGGGVAAEDGQPLEGGANVGAERATDERLHGDKRTVDRQHSKHVATVHQQADLEHRAELWQQRERGGHQSERESNVDAVGAKRSERLARCHIHAQNPRYHIHHESQSAEHYTDYIARQLDTSRENAGGQVEHYPRSFETAEHYRSYSSSFNHAKIAAAATTTTTTTTTTAATTTAATATAAAATPAATTATTTIAAATIDSENGQFARVSHRGTEPSQFDHVGTTERVRERAGTGEGEKHDSTAVSPNDIHCDYHHRTDADHHATNASQQTAAGLGECAGSAAATADAATTSGQQRFYEQRQHGELPAGRFLAKGLAGLRESERGGLGGCGSCRRGGRRRCKDPKLDAGGRRNQLLSASCLAGVERHVAEFFQPVRHSGPGASALGRENTAHAAVVENGEEDGAKDGENERDQHVEGVADTEAAAEAAGGRANRPADLRHSGRVRGTAAKLAGSEQQAGTEEKIEPADQPESVVQEEKVEREQDEAGWPATELGAQPEHGRPREDDGQRGLVERRCPRSGQSRRFLRTGRTGHERGKRDRRGRRGAKSDKRFERRRRVEREAAKPDLRGTWLWPVEGGDRTGSCADEFR